MKRWECITCGWIYDEAKGDPEEGIEPGNTLGRYSRRLGLP